MMDNRKSFKRHKLQGGLLYNSGWCINHHLNDDFTFKETIDLVYRIMRQIDMITLLTTILVNLNSIIKVK